MTTDDIVRMAREVNLWDTFDDDSNNMLGKYVVLERFASLVAAAERERFCSDLRGLHDAYSLQSVSTIRAREHDELG